MKITSFKEIEKLNITKLYATNDYGGIDVYEVVGDNLYYNGEIFDYADSIDEILTSFYYPFFSKRKEVLI